MASGRRVVEQVPSSNNAVTPSESIIRDANRTATVYDEVTGNTIEIKRFGYLDYIRLGALIAQGTQSEPTNWMIDRLIPVACVMSINGSPCIINSYRELEFLADRLGFSGIQTIATGLTEQFPELNQTENVIKKKSMTGD